MPSAASFAQRVNEKLPRLSPVERRVAEFFRENREEVLVASAARIAERVGTSDATVIRTTRNLGYAGLAALRRELADELRASLSPAARLARTLGEVGDDLETVFRLTIETHRASLDRLVSDVTPDLFRAAVMALTNAKRVAIFGIGPSSVLAQYCVNQLSRFGIEAVSLTHTGLLLADDLQRLRSDDALLILAYTRIYRELGALLDRAEELGLTTILLTDSLKSLVDKNVDLVLPVARGRTDMFSMHTATLGLLEALLVGVATARKGEAVAALALLNRLRASATGSPMDLPTATSEPQGRRKRRRVVRAKSPSAR
jgi:DNA-binding MurR/RpiR family transcriptional regulator